MERAGALTSKRMEGPCSVGLLPARTLSPAGVQADDAAVCANDSPACEEGNGVLEWMRATKARLRKGDNQ